MTPAGTKEGAWVTELTGLKDLSDWPTGNARHRPRRTTAPGRAQLRFTDANGNRLTAFAANTKGWQLPGLELRHRR